MGQTKKLDAAFDMAAVRSEIITHCLGLPQAIKTHGSNSMGWTTLAVGRCFLSIGHRLDDYTLHQPLPGIAPLPRVADLGEEMRVLGLEIIQKPGQGELQNTIDTIKRQVSLLQKLATLQAEEAR